VFQQVDTQARNAVVSGSSEWKPALLGPVAHRLTDTTGKPVFLWGQANGNRKGSARATRHDVVSMLQEVADGLLSYGGHKLAGGFELDGSPTPEFRDGLDQAVDQFQIESTEDIEPVPAELSNLNWALYNSLKALGPFGAGCPQPLFRISNVQVEDVRTFGSDNGHVGYTVSADDCRQDTVAFFANDRMKNVTAGDTISIVGALEKTTFGFDKKLRFRMESVSR
jgi:single-stranded-DNA-specific exonuclease